MTLSERSIAGIIVEIAPNVVPRLQTKRYRLITIEKLISDSQQQLGLDSRAKKVYNENGQLVSDISQVKPKQLLFISCGEPFARSSLSHKEKKAPVVETDKSDDIPLIEDRPLFRNPFIQKKKTIDLMTDTSDSFNGIPTQNNKSGANDLNTAKNPNRGNPIESALLSFAACDREERKQLPNYAALSTLLATTQNHCFVSHLVNLGIKNVMSTPITKTVHFKLLHLLQRVDLTNCNFVIAGPPQSGKTSVLFDLTCTFFKEIQISSKAETVLLLPFNFLRSDFSTIFSLFNLIITRTIEATKYCQYRLKPAIPAILSYFLSSLQLTAILPPPTTLQTSFPWIDFEKMHCMAKQFNILSQRRDGLLDFVKAILHFPANFSEAIGLQTVIWVVDHFDKCDVEYLGGQSFPESKQPVQLAPLLSREISQSMHFVSSLKQDLFYHLFPTAACRMIEMVGFIEPFDNRSLCILPSIAVSPEDCRGIPAFLNTLLEIITTVAKTKDDPISYPEMITSVQQSRGISLKMKVIALCQKLQENDIEKITPEVLGELNSSSLLSLRLF